MSNIPQTLNDKAWEKLFNKYNILSNIHTQGFYEINSKEINEFREARLMTKFDHKINLPHLFEKNNLAILPTTRGKYYIANMDAYCSFEKPVEEVLKVSIPDYIQSIDFQNITSEATAINAAYLSGILANFTGEEKLFPTVNGRMSSETFDFSISNYTQKEAHKISVSNSQIEIDGGYEGFDSLTLLEAKNSISEDFLVRQLYYPYRLWENKVRKKVRPVFLTYTNGVFHLKEYRFENVEHYNSLILINQKSYTLEQEDINLDEIVKLSRNVTIQQEPVNIPFPQADDFNRVVNVCELLNENKKLTREEITYNYGFDIRQTNYYTDACRYLGLLNKKYKHGEGVIYSLSEKGNSLFKLNLKNRNLAFAKYVLEKRAFNGVFRAYITNLELPSKEKIVDIMKKAKLYEVSAESTFRRRASTISGWINWILDLAR